MADWQIALLGVIMFACGVYVGWRAALRLVDEDMSSRYGFHKPDDRKDR